MALICPYISSEMIRFKKGIEVNRLILRQNASNSVYYYYCYPYLSYFPVSIAKGAEEKRVLAANTIIMHILGRNVWKIRYPGSYSLLNSAN